MSNIKTPIEILSEVTKRTIYAVKNRKDECVTYGECIEAIETYHNQFESKWISVFKYTPQLIENENYSNQVFAWCNNQLMIMCYCYNPSEDDAERGYFWANCNGNIDGDAEFDDNYDVTHWQPLPSAPTTQQQ